MLFTPVRKKVGFKTFLVSFGSVIIRKAFPEFSPALLGRNTLERGDNLQFS